MKIANLLIKNAQIIATMDDDRKEISNKSIYCENGKIIDKKLISKLAPNIVEGVNRLKKWSESI